MTTYTVFGQTGFSGSNSGQTTAHTIGMQFSLSSNATLNAAWFFSNTGLTALPAGIVLWNLDTGLAVESVLTASWSGAAGSGWVRAPYSGSTTLVAGTNYCTSFTDPGPGVPFYSDLNTDARFVSGGITSGIITVPATGSSIHGQAPFVTAADTLPTTSSNGINFWIDVEVSTSGGVSVSLTAPNLALAAPLLAPNVIVPLTAPNLTLAAPALSPAASGAATVALTTPNLALAAPLLSPVVSGGGGPAGSQGDPDRSGLLRKPFLW